MSVDQPSSVEMQCQDNTVDGEISVRQYVCTVEHAVCEGVGKCTIGQDSTNQGSRTRNSVSIANAKGGTTILGEEDTKVSGTAKTSSSSFGKKITKQKGGGKE